MENVEQFTEASRTDLSWYGLRVLVCPREDATKAAERSRARHGGHERKHRLAPEPSEAGGGSKNNVRVREKQHPTGSESMRSWSTACMETRQKQSAAGTQNAKPKARTVRPPALATCCYRTPSASRGDQSSDTMTTARWSQKGGFMTMRARPACTTASVLRGGVSARSQASGRRRPTFSASSATPQASGTEAADVLSLFRYPASIGDGQQEINPALGVLLLSIYKHSE
jgi:hypothetical protein